MKKIPTLLISLFTLGASAQTIDQSDLPFAGLVWTSGTDTNYSAAIPPGGTGQTWNYSSLQYDLVDTSGFGDASGTPYASFFPGANLASHKISTNTWTYFTSDPSGFYVNGFVNDTLTFVIDPRQLYVPTPFGYGDMHTDISRVVIDTTFLTYAAQVIINFHADFVADGSGSLITPTATYPSTLRVKETLLETDSLMIDYLGTGNYTLLGSQQSQSTYFRWYQHGGTANYILGIDADSLGTTANRSDYLMQWAVLGTPEIAQANEIEFYPNPASDVLHIRNNSEAIRDMAVYDISGQRLELPQISSATAIEISLSTASLSPGIYFYAVTTNRKTIRGKFNVMH